MLQGFFFSIISHRVDYIESESYLSTLAPTHPAIVASFLFVSRHKTAPLLSEHPVIPFTFFMFVYLSFMSSSSVTGTKVLT